MSLTLLGARPQFAQTQAKWKFSDVTQAAGLVTVAEVSVLGPTTLTQRAHAGAATGDYDRDGFLDLFVVTADTAVLFHNRGDGRFEDMSSAAGLANGARDASGPLFFDFDGDGWLDLFVGATDADRPHLFRNQGDGSFADVTRKVGLNALATALSASAGDFDNDGWPDLFVTHWGVARDSCHLWRNQHGERFACADRSAGLDLVGEDFVDRTFSANFVDIDRDGWADLLIAGDFHTSRVFRNRGDGSFEAWHSDVLSDENGMGSAIGDYDGDGNLDWFVSSIWDGDGVTEGDWGTSGNRLYRNLGDGTFEDVTDDAGVRQGDWGWGACFSDLNQDGVLDLFHVTGWPQGSKQFRDTPSRLFIGRDDGTFVERAAALSLNDNGGGRGVSCFDYDRDGDLDLFVANNDGSTKLWRNDGGSERGHYLSVVLSGTPPNSQAIGAWVELKTVGRAQVRQIRAGSNYVSQDPTEAHFGLGPDARVQSLSIRWPDGRTSKQTDIRADQQLVIEQPSPPSGCQVSHPGAARPRRPE